MGDPEARKALFAAAEAYVASKNVEAAFALVEAAEAFALTSRPSSAPARPGAVASPSARGAPPAGGLVVPFGAAKGKLLSEATPKDLVWLAKVLPEDVANPAKAKYAEKNQALLDAVLAELGRRAP